VPLGAWRQGQLGSGSLQGVCVLVAAIHSALSHIFDFLDGIYTLSSYLASAPHAISWRPRWRGRSLAQDNRLQHRASYVKFSQHSSRARKGQRIESPALSLSPLFHRDESSSTCRSTVPAVSSSTAATAPRRSSCERGRQITGFGTLTENVQAVSAR
jgi:hypothetical protein